jgi:hypothetical protein
MSTRYSRRPDVVAAVRSFWIAARDCPDDRLPRYGEVAEVYGGHGGCPAASPARRSTRPAPVPHRVADRAGAGPELRLAGAAPMIVICERCFSADDVSWQPLPDRVVLRRPSASVV